MRKSVLEKKQKRLMEKREALKTKALASTDVNEVRSINEQIIDINAELDEIREELEAIEAEEREQPVASGTVVPEGAEVRGSFKTDGTEKRTVPMLETIEYRMAFRDYVTNGTAIPTEFREAISTEDTSAAIPLTIMNEVINTVRKRFGNLYRKTRKLSVKGGVEIPIGSLKATFKWITESTVSPRQKLDKLGKISFSYHTAEIRIAQSFLSMLVTLDAFESKIAEVIAIAYLENMDYGIVRGTGDGQMLGILNDPRVTNEVSMSSTDFDDWKQWRKKLFSKMPLGYRSGEFIFTLSTVEAHLETMSDANNNPIFRQATGLEVNDGDAQNPNGRFFGREVSLVEPEILPDFDTADSGEVVGIYWQPDEYAINENFAFTMMRYFDHETNEWVDKAIVVVDGKIINPTGYWLIKKA